MFGVTPGPIYDPEQQLNHLSDSIGSIQVPLGTEPIVLHHDAVSAGGYMIVGT